jgi:hypothetical protein
MGGGRGFRLSRTWLFTTTSPLAPLSVAAAAATWSGVMHAMPGGTRTPYLAISSAPCTKRRIALHVRLYYFIFTCAAHTRRHARGAASHLVLMDVEVADLLELRGGGGGGPREGPAQ